MIRFEGTSGKMAVICHWLAEMPNPIFLVDYRGNDFHDLLDWYNVKPVTHVSFETTEWLVYVKAGDILVIPFIDEQFSYGTEMEQHKRLHNFQHVMETWGRRLIVVYSVQVDNRIPPIINQWLGDNIVVNVSDHTLQTVHRIYGDDDTLVTALKKLVLGET